MKSLGTLLARIGLNAKLPPPNNRMRRTRQSATLLHAQETDEATPLILTNATVIDGTGTKPRPNVTVVIEGGLISVILDADPTENIANVSGVVAEEATICF